MTFLTKLEELFMLAVFQHDGPAGLLDIREYLLDKTGKDWAVKRSREVGIRKVVGASTAGIYILLALLISVLTVSIQSVKAAVADPVASLRYE